MRASAERRVRAATVERRPTLIGPGATVAVHGQVGTGTVERVYADGCVVRWPVTGVARLVKYWEVDVRDVAADPAFLRRQAPDVGRGAGRAAVRSPVNRPPSRPARAEPIRPSSPVR